MAVQTATSGGTSYAGRVAARVVLTLAGAAGMIVGPFLGWTGGGIPGLRVRLAAFYRPDLGASGSFPVTVGGVMVLIGLLAIVGLAGRSGWITRLAGTLGIVAFALFVIELFRAGALPIGPGAWLALAGAVVALIAGFVTSQVAASPAAAGSRPAGVPTGSA